MKDTCVVRYNDNGIIKTETFKGLSWDILQGGVLAIYGAEGLIVRLYNPTAWIRMSQYEEDPEEEGV